MDDESLRAPGVTHMICDLVDAAERGVELPPGLLLDGIFINSGSEVALDTAAMLVGGRTASRMRGLASLDAARAFKKIMDD